MKCLSRNKSRFWYSNYLEKRAVVDEYGNQTGEYEILRGKPIECFANISAARGEISIRQFGDSDNYDKVIIVENLGIDIDEHSVLWVDLLPDIDTDGYAKSPYDYIVKKVARSLNNISIAISKVKVNE